MCNIWRRTGRQWHQFTNRKLDQGCVLAIGISTSVQLGFVYWVYERTPLRARRSRPLGKSIVAALPSLMLSRSNSASRSNPAKAPVPVYVVDHVERLVVK